MTTEKFFVTSTWLFSNHNRTDMWVIQNQGLLQLPDGVPLPPNSVKVELPGDFHQRPHAYKIQGDALVKRTVKELKALERPPEKPLLSLTQEEIAKLKKAIAEGKL
jgi:hypothetical protein